MVYESTEFKGTFNTYNCPVVTGYPDVVKSSLITDGLDIKIDSPPISFKNLDLLKDQLYMFFKKI